METISSVNAARAMQTGAAQVQVSDEPEVRYRQSASFWLRNPGYAETHGIGDAVRGVMDVLPGGRALADAMRPTEYGYGQPMLDQMRWQIRTRRQPDSIWWMKMNARLVGDGLTAEKYLREGRPEALVEPQHKAWLRYVQLSDQIKQTLGRPVGTDYRGPATIEPPGRRPTSAVADAYHGTSLLDRLKVEVVLKPQARQAYWRAHDESIQAAKRESKQYLGQVGQTSPEEAEFGSAWARTITAFRFLNPPTAGGWGVPLNQLLLPQMHPTEPERLTLPQKMFTGVIDGVNELFPRD